MQSVRAIQTFTESGGSKPQYAASWCPSSESVGTMFGDAVSQGKSFSSEYIHKVRDKTDYIYIHSTLSHGKSSVGC